MGKTKKERVSVTKIIPNIKNEVCVVNLGTEEDPLEIKVRKNVLMSDVSAIVSLIVEALSSKGTETAIYSPYTKDFAIDYILTTYFTNIDLPKNTDKTWAFFKGVDIRNVISDATGTNVVDDIVKTVDAVLEYKRSKELRGTKYDDLLDTILSFFMATKEKVDRIDDNELVEQVQKEYPDLKERIAAAIEQSAAVDGAPETETK